jgi:hypothetical protein
MPRFLSGTRRHKAPKSGGTVKLPHFRQVLHRPPAGRTIDPFALADKIEQRWDRLC